MNGFIQEVFNAGNFSTYSSLLDTILSICLSFILALSIGFTYIRTHKDSCYMQSYVHTLIIVSVVISVIIIVIGSNIARAFSLAGALSIIRFRSNIRDPKDIAYIFFAMASGLACGAGLYVHAVVFVLLLNLIIYLVYIMNFGTKNTKEKILKITIPEDVNYQGLVDDILQRYLERFELVKVRTTNLGTLYQLVYTIQSPEHYDEKGMIDELRCRNGNLDISILLDAEREY